MHVAEVSGLDSHPRGVGRKKLGDRRISRPSEMSKHFKQSAFCLSRTSSFRLVSDVVLDLIPDMGHHRANLHFAAGAAQVTVVPQQFILAQEHLAMRRTIELSLGRIELIFRVDDDIVTVRADKKSANRFCYTRFVFGTVGCYSDPSKISDFFEYFLDCLEVLVRSL